VGFFIQNTTSTRSTTKRHLNRYGPRRVALWVIARRTVTVEFEQKKRLLTHHKRLPLNMKTLGDWICANRIKPELRNGKKGRFAARVVGIGIDA
jgi:hypothetical protein